MALIIGIIALGLIFIFIEVFLIPGTAFVGVLGGLLMALGVFLSYTNLGVMEGNVTLGISAIILLILLVFGLRKISSLSWSLNDNIDSKVNVLEKDLVKPGDKGTTFSTLRPNGKALINNLRLEVYSIGDFIDKGDPVVVTKVTPDRIYVKPDITENNK